MRSRWHEAGLAICLLGAGPAWAAPAVVTLGGGTTGDPVADCGLMAATAYDPKRPGPGLADGAVFLDGALGACSAALEASPDSPEAQAWLARVYVLLGRGQDATPLLERASDAGNAYASYLLSTILPDAERGFALLVAASDAGYPPAQTELGDRYMSGSGVDADYSAANALFASASDAGYGLGSYRLGYSYQGGYGTDVDNDRATTFYRLAADQGEPLGYYGLGQMHEYGLGVAQDYARAAEFYQSGADMKEKMSETALAYLYEQGLGVARDFDKSFALLTDASSQDWGYAHAALSIHYLFGEGTDVDLERAYDLAWRAQQLGVVYAEGILGYLFQQGLGTTRDLSNALFHYQAGADAGDQYSAGQISVVEAEIACLDAAGSQYEPGGIGHGRDFEAIDAEAAIAACENAVSINAGAIGNRVWLARAYVKAGRYDEALPILEDGAQAGNVLAQVVFGDLLLTGTGVAADPVRAIELYEAASAQQFPLADYALGLAYEQGMGVAVDAARALDYYRRALDYGVETAAADVDRLEGGIEPPAVDLTGFGREGPAY